MTHFYDKYLSGQWTDAEIVLDDAKRYRAHKIILSTIPYFDNLFSAEGMDESVTGEVKLHNVSSRVMDILIEHAYTRQIRYTPDLTTELFVAADMLQITPIVDHCLENLYDNLQPSNCLEVLNMTKFFDSASWLHSSVLDYVSRKIEEIPGEEFKALTKDALSSILTREQLATEEEMKLFKILVTWVAGDEEDRLKEMHHLLKSIRYGTLSEDSFNLIVEHRYVTGDENCAEMMRRFMNRGEHEAFEAQIPRSPITLVCFTDVSTLAVGYRSKINGWSQCSLSYHHVDAFMGTEKTKIRVTDGDHIFTFLEAVNHETAESFLTLIKMEIATGKAVELGRVPFRFCKDQTACYYNGHIYVFNGARQDSGADADAFRFDTWTESWSDISLPPEVHEPFHALGHFGKIFLSQQFAQRMHVLNLEDMSWSRTPDFSAKYVRGIYVACGDHVYVMGGANSCCFVERLDISKNFSAWELMPCLPSNVYEDEWGAKKLIRNHIGAGLVVDSKIYVFLDSKEIFFDYTSPYLNESEHEVAAHGKAFVLDTSASTATKSKTLKPRNKKIRANGNLKWTEIRSAPLPFIKPFVFRNRTTSFVTGSEDYE